MTQPTGHLIFIGMSRSGSTWLEQTLRNDDRFHLPTTKDLFFFDRFFHRGPEWFAGRYDEAADQHDRPESPRTRVDIGHDYANGPWVPDRITATLGEDWRALLVVREPVSWLESQIRFGLRSGTFDRTALDRGDYHDLIELIEIAPFDRLVAHWQRRAGAKLHVAVFDDLRAHPQRFLNDIMAHCSIDGPPIVPIASTVNVAMEPRWEPLQRAGRSALAWSRSHDLTIVERVVKSPAMSRLAHSSTPVDFGLPDDLRSELRAYWTDGVLRLDELVPGVAHRWGYRSDASRSRSRTSAKPIE